MFPTILAIFSTFTLTLMTTSLISYRIITVSREVTVLKRTRNIYKEIVDLVMQSSAVYSANIAFVGHFVGHFPTHWDFSNQFLPVFTLDFLTDLSFFAAVGDTSKLLYFNSE